MNGSSPPKPVRSVRSASTVSRGSPQRCSASPPMKQNCQPCDWQTACSSEAAWMTSFTAGHLHEPSLLFDQTGERFGRAGWTRIVGGTAKQLDRSVGVDFPDLLAVDTLQIRARELPRFNPPFTESNLLGRPTGEGGRLLVHGTRIIEYTTAGKHRNGPPA